MIREIIEPKSNELTIKIPKEYINKKVEFIMFALDEEEKVIKEEKKSNKKMNSLRGVFNKYADSQKVALEDKAWELHVMDKFKKND